MSRYICKNLEITGDVNIKDIVEEHHVDFTCTLKKDFCIGRCQDKSGEIFYLPWVAKKCPNFKQ